MVRYYSDRTEAVLEALKFATHVVDRSSLRLGCNITVTGNKVLYSDGASAYCATFEARNFMDDRREAMAKSAAAATDTKTADDAPSADISGMMYIICGGTKAAAKAKVGITIGHGAGGLENKDLVILSVEGEGHNQHSTVVMTEMAARALAAALHGAAARINAVAPE